MPGRSNLFVSIPSMDLRFLCGLMVVGSAYRWLKWRDDCPGWYLMK